MAKVTIIGPNLSRKGQGKGTLHVHAEGCADIAHDPKGYGYRQVGGHWTIDAADKMEVITSIYPPEDFGYDAEDAEDASAYVNDVHFAPCVKF